MAFTSFGRRHRTVIGFLGPHLVHKSLRKGDTFVAWKLDRIGRDLRHLVNLVHDLTKRGVGLRVLAGEGAAIDTTIPSGRFMFGFFAALAEFELELIVERQGGPGAINARPRRAGADAGFRNPDSVVRSGPTRRTNSGNQRSAA